jgi:hypothetical protein
MAEEGNERAAGAALPRGRAFVVQLSADADPRQGRLSGRLVHLESGDASRFHDLEHLLRLLARGPAPSGAAPPRGDETKEAS